MRCWLLPACICIALVAVGCGEPPTKEMDQAQGAIDAARAAGAERYASAEFSAATGALSRAQQAVQVRDYRLALNDALESRERAQNAAREAADTMARLRGEAERLVSEVGSLLAQAEKALAAAQKVRAPRGTFEQHQAVIAAAAESLQEASAAVAAADYSAAVTAVAGAKERVAATISALEALPTAQTPRRRR